MLPTYHTLSSSWIDDFKGVEFSSTFNTEALKKNKNLLSPFPLPNMIVWQSCYACATYDGNITTAVAEAVIEITSLPNKYYIFQHYNEDNQSSTKMDSIHDKFEQCWTSLSQNFM